MKVAKILNDTILISSIYEMYPNVSFPDVGIPDSFLQEKNLYKVIDYIEYDQTYKNLIKLNDPVLIGDYVYTVQLEDKTPNEINEIKWQKARQKRNQLLQLSDLEVFIDKWEKYDSVKKNLWSDYRQKLRDLPTLYPNADNIIWPDKPI